MLWRGLGGMVEGDGVQVGVALALLVGWYNSGGLLVLGLGNLEVD